MNIKLPNFLVVGAAKAGTTSLYHYLKEHPEIFLPGIKETFFLTGKTFQDTNPKGGLYGKNSIKSIESYKSLYCTSKIVTGEICVAYLFFYKETIKNIKQHLGSKVKIIILLRNPVDRAYSNYLHHVRDTYERKSFAEALELETMRKRNKWWWGYCLKEAGLYHRQVKAYLENFDQVKIYLFDDLKEDTLGFVQDIYRFLGVEDSFVPTSISEKFNASGFPRNRFLQRFLLYDNTIRRILRTAVRFLMPDWEKRQNIVRKLQRRNLKKEPMPSEAREYLRDFFKEDILMLQDLIRRDLSHWLD